MQLRDDRVFDLGKGVRAHLFLGSGVQAVSCGAAPESSPRRQPWGSALKGKSRGAAKELVALFLSPLPGLCLHCAFSPRLTVGYSLTPLCGSKLASLRCRTAQQLRCSRAAGAPHTAALRMAIFRQAHSPILVKFSVCRRRLEL